MRNRLKVYQFTAIFSMVFAVVGFTYNTWRMEVFESNNNIRLASFEVLTELAALEQLIYAAHYDNNIDDGNPRNGWVKIGLIANLSSLINPSVKQQADALHKAWSQSWSTFASDRESTNLLIQHIEHIRTEIERTLQDKTE